MSETVPRGRPAEILLVEDEPSVVQRTDGALRRTAVESRLRVAEDAGAPRPGPVPPDPNPPGMDGHQVLSGIDSDDDPRRIPVIARTTSNAPPDVARCYDPHANCTIPTPADFDAFETVVRRSERFRLRPVALPPSER